MHTLFKAAPAFKKYRASMHTLFKAAPAFKKYRASMHTKAGHFCPA